MSVDTLSVQDVVVQSEGYLVSDMNGEKVMLSIDNGKYYNLGQVGGRIWELVAAPISVGELVQQLMDEYEIDRDSCENQVQSFLKQLGGEGLIQIRKDA